MTTKYENVTFVNAAVRKLSEAEFIEAHIGCLWKDRKESVRKKMLVRVYKLINGDSGKSDK